MRRILLFAIPPFGLALATVALALFAQATDQERDTKDRALQANRPAETKELRREGSRFEGNGRFEITGARAAFIPSDGAETFRVLENLSLERVSRVLAETREPRQWNVVGVFTEYQGSNYLLVSKAVVKLPEVKEPGRGAAEASAGNVGGAKKASP